jgi:hypothetical protein
MSTVPLRKRQQSRHALQRARIIIDHDHDCLCICLMIQQVRFDAPLFFRDPVVNVLTRSAFVALPNEISLLLELRRIVLSAGGG